jgi:hypothetical protein
LGEFADHLDPNEGTRGQLGDAGCPRDPIIQHQNSVRPFVYPRRRHAEGRPAEKGYLAGELTRIRSLPAGWRDTQLTGINVAEIRHSVRLRWPIQRLNRTAPEERKRFLSHEQIVILPMGQDQSHGN